MALSKERRTRLTHNPNTEANTESISVPSMVLNKERRTRSTQNATTDSKHRIQHRIQHRIHLDAQQAEAHSKHTESICVLSPPTGTTETLSHTSNVLQIPIVRIFSHEYKTTEIKRFKYKL
ncbi:MAG: hypothetical protein GY941_03675 [Planctomycetes bacterium]|nr:hypothetical protein [Planctomycetota bacterium]